MNQEKDTMCPSCGAAVRPGAKFCRSCGTVLDQSSGKQARQESEPPGSKQPLRRLLLTIAILALVGGGTGAWLLFKDSGSGPSSVTEAPTVSSPNVQPTTGEVAAPTTRSTSAVGQEIGDLDLDGYCRSLGDSGASLTADRFSPNAVNAWRCVSPGRLDPIDTQAACRWQYSDKSLIAQPLDVNDAYTWRCYTPTGAP